MQWKQVVCTHYGLLCKLGLGLLCSKYIVICERGKPKVVAELKESYCSPHTYVPHNRQLCKNAYTNMFALIVN